MSPRAYLRPWGVQPGTAWWFSALPPPVNGTVFLTDTVSRSHTQHNTTLYIWEVLEFSSLFNTTWTFSRLDILESELEKVGRTFLLLSSFLQVWKKPFRLVDRNTQKKNQASERRALKAASLKARVTFFDFFPCTWNTCNNPGLPLFQTHCRRRQAKLNWGRGLLPEGVEAPQKAEKLVIQVPGPGRWHGSHEEEQRYADQSFKNRREGHARGRKGGGGVLGGTFSRMITTTVIFFLDVYNPLCWCWYWGKHYLLQSQKLKLESNELPGTFCPFLLKYHNMSS